MPRWESGRETRPRRQSCASATRRAPSRTEEVDDGGSIGIPVRKEHHVSVPRRTFSRSDGIDSKESRRDVRMSERC